MNLTVYPGHPLKGEVHLPGDKSLSHRAALFAALAEGESRIENFLVSGVTQAMLNALTALGVSWTLQGSTLQVSGHGLGGLKAPAAPLDCGNSATTLRLLAGALAASGLPAVLDGSPGLRLRPMNRILEPLKQMDAPIEGSAGGCAPLKLRLRPAKRILHAIEYSLPVASAQVKSCLMLAGLACDGALVLHEPGPSRDHTERLLRHMGVQVVWDFSVKHGSSVALYPPTRPLRPLNMALPGDISSAAFLVVAALVTPGSDVLIRNVGLNPTRTGLLDALKAMGASIEIRPGPDQAGEPSGDLRACYSPLSATQISDGLVVRMIDEFPILAVAACRAAGATIVRDAAELRNKESDRIAALGQELRKLGVPLSESPDGFSVQGPADLGGALVTPHGDHRLAMSLAVAGLAARAPVTIQEAEIMNESFPEFTDVLRTLGAELESGETA